MSADIKQITLEAELEKLHTKRDNLLTKMRSNYDLGVRLKSELDQVEYNIIQIWGGYEYE